MAEVTPLVPAGRQVVETYGGGGFRVSGEGYRGSIIVRADRTAIWPVCSFPELSPDSFAPVLAWAGEIDILLLGCGERLALVPRPIREELRAAGIVVEPMGTGAACRTYNVLLAEDRRVAAALIAID